MMSPSTMLGQFEAAAVRSWPALETADIGGWLWRYASGGSFRANSVSALEFDGGDMVAAIHEVERRYRAKSARCLFTITEVSEPAGLDARLASMGYAQGEPHATMAKVISLARHRPADVELSAEPSPEWLPIYLAGLSADRRAVAPRILAGLPPRRCFFSCRRAGAVVGSGLSVADGQLASVQCMATLASARRQGAAQSVLRAVEAWAAGQGCTYLYLQVESVNVGAIALYEAFGFRVAGRYHVRVKP
jgi:ribosomal protein S18 acetylase RimI-like enzyme